MEGERDDETQMSVESSCEKVQACPNLKFNLAFKVQG
jgi:hypothetical protein